MGTCVRQPLLRGSCWWFGLSDPGRAACLDASIDDDLTSCCRGPKARVVNVQPGDGDRPAHIHAEQREPPGMPNLPRASTGRARCRPDLEESHPAGPRVAPPLRRGGRAPGRSTRVGKRVTLSARVTLVANAGALPPPYRTIWTSAASNAPRMLEDRFYFLPEMRCPGKAWQPAIGLSRCFPYPHEHGVGPRRTRPTVARYRRRRRQTACQASR